MQRRTKRQTKNQQSNPKVSRQAADGADPHGPSPNGSGLWSSKPGADLSLLLSRVRAAQVRRLHFR